MTMHLSMFVFLLQVGGDEAERAGKRNVETLKAADSLIQAIELLEIEETKVCAWLNVCTVCANGISKSSSLSLTSGGTHGKQS